MFFLLYKRTDNGVLDYFSEDFRPLTENFRRFPKTFEEDPKMFRCYTNEFKCNLRDKPDVTEIIDIFTCEDIISSHVRTSYLHM